MIAHDSPVFRPLEVCAHLAYAVATLGEALTSRILRNRSLSLATFGWHHIHLITTLYALTTAVRMPLACLLGIILLFRVYFDRQPYRPFIRGVPVDLHLIRCYIQSPSISALVSHVYCSYRHHSRSLICSDARIPARTLAYAFAHLPMHSRPFLNMVRSTPMIAAPSPSPYIHIPGASHTT